ncbi:hypothetical protein PSTT_09957, partial [Puccinia striiformis]
AGSFKSFRINPTESSDPIIRSGIIHCWFVGQEEGLKLGCFSPGHREKKKKSKFQLQDFDLQLRNVQQVSLSKLTISITKMELSDNIKCCSETKDGSNKVLKRVPLPWCSVEFSTLAWQLDKIQIHKSSNSKGQYPQI